MPQNENSENCSENLPPWYRCSCPHIAAVLTWQLSSPGSCPHLAAVLTWQLSSPRNCSILAAVLTWQLSSPDSCSLLAAVFTWQLFYHSSCPHLAAVLTRTWQLFLLVTCSCSYSYLAAVLTRTWQLSLPNKNLILIKTWLRICEAKLAVFKELNYQNIHDVSKLENRKKSTKSIHPIVCTVYPWR